MQNLIVLCHRCLTWGETHAELCTECGAEVRIDLPDVDLATLNEILGSPMTVMGPLHVERPELPNFGYIIGTSRGFLFLPRLHRRVNGAWEGITSQRLPGWWPFRGDQTSPRFLNWLRSPFGTVGGQPLKPESLTPQDIGSPADRLMDSPGAFFVELRLIRSLAGRRRRIMLERPPLKSLIFVDETEEGSLLQSLNSHIVEAAKERERMLGDNV